ncbi:hypothetical protein IMZ31_24255 (plasmid) [Pontibacillus sp. ALD_SL1]|uniref:hypothetical protein n=1 Tax=Pontibacillus sp. ALD_SL1 TaxID=2777185 RepID=UPI001A9677AC|nr:hypothetical protein [Pontibacillus sp. ALD_SL1]QST02566.1 hypothetical protein IMZ31_24255 [Pontibacillus sp. ALD_SL1]
MKGIGMGFLMLVLVWLILFTLGILVHATGSLLALRPYTNDLIQTFLKESATLANVITFVILMFIIPFGLVSYQKSRE